MVQRAMRGRTTRRVGKVAYPLPGPFSRKQARGAILSVWQFRLCRNCHTEKITFALEGGDRR